MFERDDNTRPDARQKSSRPNYRIQGENSRVVSYTNNIKIQELSDDRWAVFVKIRNPGYRFDPTGGSYSPTGPIHKSPQDAKVYLRRMGV